MIEIVKKDINEVITYLDCLSLAAKVYYLYFKDDEYKEEYIMLRNAIVYLRENYDKNS